MVLKKKTIVIITLILLIVAAGYVSSKYGKPIKVNNDVDEMNDLSNNETATNATVAAGFFVDAKLSRESQRTSSKQTLKEIIDNTNSSKEAKAKAENQMLSLINYSEKEMIIEALIKSKGFDDALVLLDENSANITVKTKQLSSDEVNFIKNIVCRETNITASKIMVQARE